MIFQQFNFMDLDWMEYAIRDHGILEQTWNVVNKLMFPHEHYISYFCSLPFH